MVEMKAVRGIRVAGTEGHAGRPPLAGGVGSVGHDSLSVLVYNRSSELAPLHLCPVRGQATGKFRARVVVGWLEGACQVLSASGDRLSQQRLGRQRVLFKHALPPPLTSSASRRVKDPRVTVFLHVSAGALGAHWSCSQCWWRGGEDPRPKHPLATLAGQSGGPERCAWIELIPSPPPLGLHHSYQASLLLLPL